MTTSNSLILGLGEMPIENSPSSATITPSLSQPSGPSGSCIQNMSPRSPTAFRLVSFSSESLGPPFEAGTPPGQGSRIFRVSSPSPSISNSTIHQHDVALVGGAGFGGRPSPSPPSQSRNRSLSRMSRSGSMANLMNLVRSKSTSRASRGDGVVLSMSMSVEGSAPGGWFGKARSSFMKPWHSADTEGTDESASEEGKRAFGETKQAVLATLKKVLGVAADATVEALMVSGSLLEHVPVPYLYRVCNMFISIWKAVQQVTMNRLAFLRLTQTCTTILDSIYKELEDADENIIQELRGPIQGLERSFEKLLSVIEAQINTPFLWRYARRDDTSKEIAGCNDSLLRSLALFTSTIQLRTYQAVRANAKICAESYQQLKLMAEQVSGGSPSQLSLNSFSRETRRLSAPEGMPYPSSRDLVGIRASPTIVSHSVESFFNGSEPSAAAHPHPRPTIPTVIPVLQHLQTTQNAEDSKLDVEELKRSMRTILDTGSDMAILGFLGIDKADIPEAIKTLQRMREANGGDKLGGCGGEMDEVIRDTLHQEFIEAGIDALRRMSDCAATDLPYWTITPFEVQRGSKIGMGFFSEVFQGKWDGRTVAVKVLSEVTPSDLFIREIKVWKGLRHPNVLKLYGASSATGNPPWFFVSPFMKHGNLAEFLRRVSRQDQADLVGLGTIVENLPSSKSRGCFGKGNFRLLKVDDTYRMLQEIAKGMEYLHLKGVLHGDLKASNVLVDDDHRCVISDFGQSELKSEVCRITGSSMKTGTLRWKAPELLEGSFMLTPATDIYAYAIVCIEVLSMGELPWGCVPDDEIRHNVLEMDRRPMIPVEFTSPLLHELIGACWHRDPAKRVPFNEIVFRLHRLRAIAGDGWDPSFMNDENDSWFGSPCMSPRSTFSRPLSPTPASHSDSGEFCDFVAVPSPEEVDALRLEDNIVPSNIKGDSWKMPEPVHYTSDMKVMQTHLESRSMYTNTTVTNSDEDLSRSMMDSVTRSQSPPVTMRMEMRTTSGTANNALVMPAVVAAEARNERRYRYLLEHEFNSSLTLPLWDPSPVQIGDVGYVSKPRGAFVTLFNAIKPSKAVMNLGLGPVSEYGSTSKGSMRLEKRSAAQKGLDAFSGLLAFSKSRTEPVTRRQSFRLRSGHKCAHVYTESAEYQYLKKLEAVKAWFRDNVEQILNTYGREHNIHKEDLFLIISLLQARDYSLFVSHKHPNAQVHFGVVNGAKKGQPWGTFTFERNVPSGRNGPLYEDDGDGEVGHDYASKVSAVGDPFKALIVGRLRFKPDSMWPTSLK